MAIVTSFICGKSDINAVSCPEIYQCVEKLPLSDSDDNTVCVLSQKGTLCNAYQQGGPQTPDMNEPTPSTSMSLFGIALCEDHRDELNLLTDARAKNRQLLHAHCSDKLATFENWGC